MTKTVLVTGASGFIGKFVVPALAKGGWQVRAAARDPGCCEARHRGRGHAGFETHDRLGSPTRRR